ncbi:MAG: hypothetical protein PF589_04325, partial [Gammaproteobacteria bacterium]|nr:hypothetical protein [Gammaproteobacteria bacterium]
MSRAHDAATRQVNVRVRRRRQPVYAPLNRAGAGQLCRSVFGVILAVTYVLLVCLYIHILSTIVLVAFDLSHGGHP